MKICPKCNKEHEKPGVFCCRACANSRGKRSDEFKKRVSDRLTGRVVPEDQIIKAIKSRGRRVWFDKEDSVCCICGTSTGSKQRMTCSSECYAELARRNSQKNPKCGGQKHTHRSEIKNNKNEIYTAESSYEVRLAHILNGLDVYWIRPSFVWYTDDYGRQRRYYPDFYIPSIDVYLDPKNDYLIKTDIEKISRTCRENQIKVIILGEDHLNEDTVRKLVGDDGNAPPYPACKTGVLLLN